MLSEGKDPLFAHPLETVSGLTISDLNRYLPAIQKVEDIQMTRGEMREGLFLGLGQEGLKHLPENSIDLIIVDPPESPRRGPDNNATPMTLQQYYQWNDQWLKESYRVLKSTGAIYLISGWQYSGMYQALLNNYFRIQTRITWRNSSPKDQSPAKTWTGQLSDIWFATKSDDFFFNQETILKGRKISRTANISELGTTNFWSDILDIQVGTTVKMDGDKPEQLVQRILKASSFKLNWVVDPFMRSGGVGVVVTQLGRRFIGFESDQDRLLMAMKRIDRE